MTVRTLRLAPGAASASAIAVAVLAVLSLSAAAWAATDAVRDPDYTSHPMTHMGSAVLVVRGSGDLQATLEDGRGVVAEGWNGHHGIHFEVGPGTYTVDVTLDGYTGSADILIEGMVRLDARIVDGELVLEASEGHMMGPGHMDGGMDGHMGGGMDGGMQ